MKKSVLITSLAVIISISPAFGQDTDKATKQSDLERLISYMSGSFSSREQSLEDTTFFDIRLEMVPIWRERSDAHWLYVEQAVAGFENQPYRQRVYRVSKIDDSTYVSDAYLIDEPRRFAGEWKEEQPLAKLTPDSLILRENCGIYLKPEGDSVFVGSTKGTDCESSLRGSAYATSKVRIGEDYLYSWDRGFDTDGNQVWGAEKGGYIFKKIEK